MRARGLSLLETVLGFGLLGLLLLSSLGLFLNGYRAQAYGYSRAQASELAADAMSRLKAVPYQSLVTRVGSPPVQLTRRHGAQEYAISTAVARGSTDPNNLEHAELRIEVNVVWLARAQVDANQGRTTPDSQLQYRLESWISPGGAF